MDDVDQAVYYYLDTLDRFDMLGQQRISGSLPEDIKMESAIKARKLAGKTAVLLKNAENILPLNPEKETIAIIGPTGNRQATPIFKESSYGFKDRLTGTCQVLNEMYPGRITFAVGNDLDGEVIPTEFLKPEAGSKKRGLERYIGGYTYNTLGNGEIDQIPTPDGEVVIDEIIDYSGDNALPVVAWGDENADLSETPLPYYNWHGFICPPINYWASLAPSPLVGL